VGRAALPEETLDAAQPANRASQAACRTPWSAPVVDVLGAMVDAYEHEGQQLFIPWDGHNSSIANRVIARELAAAILSDW
jgi:hypothetical protein